VVAQWLEIGGPRIHVTSQSSCYKKEQNKWKTWLFFGFLGKKPFKCLNIKRSVNLQPNQNENSRCFVMINVYNSTLYILWLNLRTTLNRPFFTFGLIIQLQDELSFCSRRQSYKRSFVLKKTKIVLKTKTVHYLKQFKAILI
jgi:hypothetical protein